MIFGEIERIDLCEWSDALPCLTLRGFARGATPVSIHVTDEAVRGLLRALVPLLAVKLAEHGRKQERAAADDAG